MAKRKVTWKIETRDCIKALEAMNARTVDLIFADPPFNIGVDYDTYRDQEKTENYISWCSSWIRLSYAVLKPCGTFWIAINDENVSELDWAAKRCGFHKRSHVVWYVTFGVSCTNNFARSHVHLLYYVKNKKKFTFNKADRRIRVASARQLVYNDSRANPDGKLPDNTWVLSPLDLKKTFTKSEDTWLESRVCGTFKEKQDTPNQMPLTVLERIVLSTSRPGDLVADPFNGSGTSGAAAISHGRNYLGFDISSKYCKAARTRLKQIEKGK